MMRELTVKWLRVGFVGSLLVVASLPSNANAQTSSHVPRLGDRDADATRFLAQVRQLYVNATSYNIAAVQEEQMSAQFSRRWSNPSLSPPALVRTGTVSKPIPTGEHGSSYRTARPNGSIDP
jgi:hypothetical protein